MVTRVRHESFFFCPIREKNTSDSNLKPLAPVLSPQEIKYTPHVNNQSGAAAAWLRLLEGGGFHVVVDGGEHLGLLHEDNYYPHSRFILIHPLLLIL
jgi:hypothetical protein